MSIFEIFTGKRKVREQYTGKDQNRSEERRVGERVWTWV